jgi:Concanavalin A-like lectin/glucanases superfamily
VATVTGTSYDDTGLLSGTSYSYRVRAADNAGNLSGYSNVVTAITESQASGLVAAYAFDEGAGSVVADASGNGHTGTISGATWIAAGRYNRGLDFNGTNALVTIGDAAKLDLTTGMTLAAWVYPTPTLTNWSTVVMKEQPGHFVYTLYAGSPANRPSLYFNISTGSSGERSVTGPTALPLNTWTHLAGAYDGATLRLYVNGTPVASQAATGAIATSVSPLRIGGNAVWGEYFRGRIDEVRVYNRAFSQADIQQAMNTPLSATPPDPVPPK